MPWTYHQTTGELDYNGQLISTGYSGAPGAINNPNRESERLIGPIPRGVYRIGQMQNNGRHMGNDVLPLTPVGHNAHGRSAFYIHGDSVARPGTASQGCVILPHAVRARINLSLDKVLQVVR